MMAPVQGHLMVPKAMNVVKFAIAQAKSLLHSKPHTAAQTSASLNPVHTQKTIAVHPNALLKHTKPTRSQPYNSRNHSTFQNSTGKSSGPKYNRSSFPTSRTSRAIAQKGAAPFASTLRPNLTGGTLPRSAGGYSLGGVGRARQFSHTTGCQAQVIQNVSAGIRAFFVNGGKARFDGIDPVTGEKKWKAITQKQNEVYEKWLAAPRAPRGTSLEFKLSPTITALLPTSSEVAGVARDAAADEITLTSTGVLGALSGDFARAFRDLALITHDLSKLATFGDLPLSLTHTPSGPLLRVRFPGCDADAVSALCDEVDICRGVIVEDPAWAESRDADMALLFPFAPAETSEELDMGDYFAGRQTLMMERRRRESVRWRGMSRSLMSCGSSSPSPSLEVGQEEEEMSALHYKHPLLSSSSPLSSPPEGYESGDSYSDLYYDSSSPLPSSFSAVHHHHNHSPAQRTTDRRASNSEEEAQYEGVEGIYRFLREIDDARRR